MRCPHCQQRALGIVAWVGHQLYQPIWRQDRYHTTCRACGTRLKPTARERVVAHVLVIAGVATAVGARLSLTPPRPSVWLFAVLGCVVGILVQYPLARYVPVDPAVLSNLPTVRAVEDSKR